MGRSKGEQGVALIGAILAVLILSTLGTVSLNLSVNEIESVKAIRDEAVAQHLAEAGSDLVMQWFHDPTSAPTGLAGSLLTKRYELPNIGPSFFDARGVSQFSGTSDRPDLLFDASVPADDRLLNDPSVGWFRSLRTLGRMLRLKVYGPIRPSLLCTVEVTAGVGELRRTLSVQLGANSIPPLRAGVQIENGRASQVPDRPLPIWLHWGDLKVKGDAHLGSTRAVPVQTTLAPVTGQSYAEMVRQEDRWLNVWVGGDVLFAPASSGLPPPAPSNVYPRRDPVPGLNEDRWNYETMKQLALRFGSYYVPDRDGLLHRNGQLEPESGMTAEEVFKSDAVGDHHGLVFVDTLDQRPPGTGNLATLTIETEYSEGLFVINAHVHLKPKGIGKAVPALSPPSEESTSVRTRIPVQLTGVHLQGVLYAAGDVVVEGRPRMYGALVVGGQLSQASDISGPLEVWYTYDLQRGLFRGIPLVYVAPETQFEKY